MQQPIISVSGLRGRFGESLDEHIAARYALAFAETLPQGPILIGRDGRESGIILRAAIARALARRGRQVIDADVTATPTVGILARQHQVAGAIQITASHNPLPYNGLKLFSYSGRVIDKAAGEAVLDKYMSMAAASQDEPHPRATESQPNDGGFRTLADTTSRHLEKVVGLVDVEKIRRRQFRILLDCNHGAGSVLGRQLLDHLGVKAELVGGTPDGRFAHSPEPTQQNLQQLAATVATRNFDAAFCQDPDADRLAIIDHQGRYIGEEYTLAFALDHVLGKRTGPVVINCATSRMSIDIAEKYGVQCFISAVGEANVCDEMIRRDAVFGGEGNGGPIDPMVGYVRDSFVAMALVLNALAERGISVAQWVDQLPTYAIHKTTLTLAAEMVDPWLRAVESSLAEPQCQISRLDGLRLDWPDRWLLARPSNTEPIVRIICEAPTDAEAAQLAAQAAAALDDSQASKTGPS